MPFPQSIREQALLACKRYCCYCEKYSGLNMEVHHIIQEADGGPNTFDNAIPVCLNCHATIGAYNTRHPKGTKYSSKELKKIRDDFYKRIKKIPRKADQKSDADKKLLETFKDDFTDILEYIIDTDFTAQLVNIGLSDKIDSLVSKWSKKKKIFEFKLLEDTKLDIINAVCELQQYLSIKFFRLHEPTGFLIFRNESYEEGENLKEVLRPNTLRIRTRTKQLLDQLYSY